MLLNNKNFCQILILQKFLVKVKRKEPLVPHMND